VTGLRLRWLLLAASLSFSAAARADGLSLDCPCTLLSNGPSSIAVTAGVSNRGSGTSGSLRLRIVAHPSRHAFDSGFFNVGYVYLSTPLLAGQSLPSQEFLTGFYAPADDNRFYTVFLQQLESTATGPQWLTRDSVRMGNGARPVAEAGSVGFFVDDAVHAAVFWNGPVRSVVNGARIDLELPELRNVSPGATTGSLRLELRQQSASGSYYFLGDLPLNAQLPPGTSIAPLTLSMPYSPVNDPGFDRVTLALVDASRGTLITQPLFNRSGAPVAERRFRMTSLDVTTDSDGDGATDYAELLAGTRADSAAMTPGPAAIRLLAYYTADYAAEFFGDPLTRITHLVNLSNQILADSGVNAVLELAQVAAIAITDEQSSSPRETLDRMNDGLPPFDGLYSARKSTLADVALTFRTHGPGAPDSGLCGIASLTASEEDADLGSAFYASSANGVISESTSNCPDDTTAHELGHIFGLSHSRRQTQFGETPGTLPWATGYGVDNAFTTLMAYSSAFGGALADSVSLFSSPDLDCNGLPCGVDAADSANGADAVQALSLLVQQVASFTRDTDGDGIADALDPDDDGDGTPDSADEAPWDATDTVDLDLDGLGDASDPDDDNDGEPDVSDAFPADPFEIADTDGDGVGNNADDDDDGDGFSDLDEIAQGTDPLDAGDYPGAGPARWWRFAL
jgi:hypothetical protein